MKIKTICIDFGNVIGFFDHQRAIEQFARFTTMPTMELTLAIYGGTLEDDYEQGFLTTAEFTRQAKLNGRLTCSDGEFLAAFVDIFWRNAEVCDLIPQLAQNHQLLLASNTNDAHFKKYCEQFADVIEHFDSLCPSHILQARKPHAPYFERCQTYIESRPQECLFIDDLGVNTEAARRHGWQTLDYQPKQNLHDQLAALGVI